MTSAAVAQGAPALCGSFGRQGPRHYHAWLRLERGATGAFCMQHVRRLVAALRRTSVIRARVAHCHWRCALRPCIHCSSKS